MFCQYFHFIQTRASYESLSWRGRINTERTIVPQGQTHSATVRLLLQKTRANRTSVLSTEAKVKSGGDMR